MCLCAHECIVGGGLERRQTQGFMRGEERRAMESTDPVSDAKVQVGILLLLPLSSTYIFEHSPSSFSDLSGCLFTSQTIQSTLYKCYTFNC